jgi:hypothetical protein
MCDPPPFPDPPTTVAIESWSNKLRQLGRNGEWCVAYLRRHRKEAQALGDCTAFVSEEGDPF